MCLCVCVYTCLQSKFLPMMDHLHNSMLFYTKKFIKKLMTLANIITNKIHTYMYNI